MSEDNEKKPQTADWLEAFLERTYFTSCLKHPFRKNELNKYCIDCDMSACQYCLSYNNIHDQHRIIKIYRHVYKDVVSLATMENHIDCSLIQPYKCNKKLVIALNPLPHSGSCTMSNSEAFCVSCNRRLSEPNLYRYCSISCQARAFSRKSTDSVPPFLANAESEAEVSEPQIKTMHKRKRIPSRAPFF